MQFTQSQGTNNLAETTGTFDKTVTNDPEAGAPLEANDNKWQVYCPGIAQYEGSWQFTCSFWLQQGWTSNGKINNVAAGDSLRFNAGYKTYQSRLATTPL